MVIWSKLPPLSLPCKITIRTVTMLLIIESEPVMLQEVVVVLVYCDRKLQSKTFYFCLGCLSLYQIIKICTRLWEDALKNWAAKTAMRGRPVDDKPQKQAVEPQKKTTENNECLTRQWNWWSDFDDWLTGRQAFDLTTVIRRPDD